MGKCKTMSEKIVDSTFLSEVNVENALCLAMKMPGVKINRSAFLEKELRNRFPQDVVEDAVIFNPAYAGITRTDVNTIAKQIINYETNKVSAISFAAGVPGGFAMMATVPADIVQYFGFILRVMQKLAYLYGFKEFALNEDDIDDGTMNQILIFLGVMFGVQEANAAVKTLAGIAAQNVAKKLSRQALTKGIVYPVVKKIAQRIGINMTKQLFAKSVSKVVPLIGGVTTGTLTYVTFKPCANKLKKNFESLPLSDPSFYSSREFANGV